MPDVLALFDAADPNSVTVVRHDATVPSQSLFLFNHPFALAQAKAFAQRLLADAKATDDDWLKVRNATRWVASHRSVNSPRAVIM